MKNWQFNVIFFAAVGGVFLLLLGPELGIELSDNPIAFSGVGAMLTYILTQKKSLTKSDRNNRQTKDSRTDEESDPEEV